MNSLLQDIRHAARSLRRNPGFAAVAVATLALGIGATTAVFSVVDGILLRALPVPEPSRVVFITRSGDVSIPDGRDWRASAPSLESVALFLRGWDLDLTGQGEPERLKASVVEPDYFRVLKIAPLLGRSLEPADNRPGGDRVAVISEGLWKRRFHGDPGVIGRVVSLSDHPTTIVGVMPERFDVLGDATGVWVPAAVETPWALEERGTNNFDAIGRLAPTASLSGAKAELRAVCERLEKQFPRTNQGKIVEPILLLDFLVGSVRRGLVILFAAVAFVMLIGCINLASLLLARFASRMPEIALRQALGASSRRIVQQVLVEAEVLSLAGAIFGFPVALAGTRLLLALAPAELPRSEGVGLNFAVLGFGIGIALFSGLACALLPLWRARRIAPALGLSLLGGRILGRRARGDSFNLIVGIEVALALPLVIAAQLLARSFLQLDSVPLGFDPHRVVTADLVLPESRYSEREAQTRTFRRIVENLAATPGVESASSVIGAPLQPSGRGIGSSLEVEGVLPDSTGRTPSARVRPVAGEYFRALRIPVIQGRAFVPTDDDTHEPVVVVNRSFVRRFWPGQNPVGKKIRFSGWDDPRWFRVVGLVADTKSADLTADDTRAVYLPYFQRAPAWQRFGTLVVRGSGNSELSIEQIQRAVWRADPALTIGEVEPLEHRLSQSLGTSRFLAQVLGAFALGALALAAQGLYGVLAYAVTLRRREFGVRIALGATRGNLMANVAGRGLPPVFAGLLAGIGAALLTRRAIASLLFGVSSSDAATYFAAAGAILLVTSAAIWLPARRAASVDPMEALRHE